MKVSSLAKDFSRLSRAGKSNEINASAPFGRIAKRFLMDSPALPKLHRNREEKRRHTSPKASLSEGGGPRQRWWEWRR